VHLGDALVGYRRGSWVDHWSHLGLCSRKS